VGWADADLRIHLLGWLAMRTDDQIQEEAVELVGALENMAYTNTITKMGEGVMTDVVELCTTLTNKGPDNLTTYSMEGDEARGQDNQPGDRGQQHQLQPHHLPPQPQQLGDMEDTGLGQHHQPEVGDISCINSMHKRMPRSKSWASQGGISPMESSVNQNLTTFNFPKAREEQRDSPGEHQHHPPEAQGHDHQPGDKGATAKDQQHQPEEMQAEGQSQGGEGQHHQQGGQGQHQPPGVLGEEQRVSCAISMHDRMPSSIIWASQGGIAPKEIIIEKKVTPSLLHGNGQEVKEITLERGVWVEGGGEENNIRYRASLLTVRREERRQRSCKKEMKTGRERLRGRKRYGT
jgi:hypothetical protein